MRHHGRVAVAILGIALSGMLACDGTGPEGPPVDSELQCGDPGSPPVECTLPLEQRSRFTITLVSTSCLAPGNTILLISPESDELTDDACYEGAGKTWEYNDAYEAATQLDFRIVSAQAPNPPRFLASGSYPNWTLTFEDGYDTDFDDIVLQVTATPVP